MNPSESSFGSLLSSTAVASEGRAHHHTDTGSCLGDGPQSIGKVVGDGTAHHGCVSGEAVDELAGPIPVKKCHFLSEDGGEDAGSEITNNLLA